MVPLLDLRAQYRQLQNEVDAAVHRVLESSEFIGGRESECLERELAGYLGVTDVVTVNSGTDALVLSLKALGVGSGDEVIVPSFTFFATAAAVSLAGATPKFADCAPDSYNVDISALQKAKGQHTKAVIVVHLFGEPVDLSPIQKWCTEHGLWLIEDAAQAIGARYADQSVGSVGDIGAFSFYPTKNLGAFGDGGAIACRDPAIARCLRQLRNHGRAGRYEHQVIGCNSRLDEIQAAILRAKLPFLDTWNERRRRLAARYQRGLQGTVCRWQTANVQATPVYHQFVIRHPQRDALQAFLTTHGIATAVFYSIPCHLQPALAESHGEVSLQHAERLSEEVLALPIYPELTEEAVDHVTGLVHLFEQQR
ncbi:DegT/DnrJ/EryC1/StrS family aminotransferase [Dyella tabacisoli]|uniref:DegT/DnrJ/EryC1/StrS family aminotransferase n=1 Tax=Dyella tabacisoli TaxID=2282381 RepID=A0A369UQB1_9GAMM|nr:DegT/DnrJ/EryC1/StrS family aminotransferase [Dyella tabacisoli]